jgi:outer membrane protein assembly factor BamE (lipoprotein component of BamABCDE complex)
MRALLILFILAAGCEHYRVPERGVVMRKKDLETIKAGVTTKKDLRRLFGKPHYMNAEDPDRAEWHYYYSYEQTVEHASILGHNLDDRREWTRLILHFDLYGRVTDFKVEKYQAALDNTDKAGGILPRPPVSIRR